MKVLVSTPEFEDGLKYHKNYYRDRHYHRCVDQWLEEVAELQKLFIKQRRNRNVKDKIEDEAIDVLYCLEYIFRELGTTEEKILAKLSCRSKKMINKLKEGIE